MRLQIQFEKCKIGLSSLPLKAVDASYLVSPSSPSLQPVSQVFSLPFPMFAAML